MAEQEQGLGGVRAEHAEGEGAEGEGEEEEGGQRRAERLEERRDAEGEGAGGAGGWELRHVVGVEEEEDAESEGYADDVCEGEEDAQWECQGRARADGVFDGCWGGSAGMEGRRTGEHG